MVSIMLTGTRLRSGSGMPKTDFSVGMRKSPWLTDPDRYLTTVHSGTFCPVA
jgi:hypothetical protein